jgi:hypothetical protein
MLKKLLITAAVLIAGAAYAQTTTLDQVPVPLSSTTNSELLTQSISVSGGTLYATTLKQGGAGGAPVAVAQTFVPTATGGTTRNLPLTAAKSDAGVALTATATSGAVGVTRTAGTGLTLDGEATSGNAKTDKAVWEFNLPDSYVAGQNIAVTVNCNYSGAGTVTGASTTMTVAAYTESTAGAETALTVSAAQQMAATAGPLVFTITGTGLVPGQRVALELVMLVTSSSGANTGHINSVSYGG